MDELRQEIAGLKKENESLKSDIQFVKESVLGNRRDYQQLRDQMRVYIVGPVGNFKRIKLSKKSLTTLIVSLTLGLTNFFLQFFNVV